MAGDKVTVPVDADARLALLKVADLRATLDLLARRAYSARIIVDDAGLQAQLARIAAQLRAAGKTVASPKLTLEGAAKAEAQILAVAAQMDKISGRVAKAHVAIDDADAERRIALLITQMAALQTRLTDLRIGVEDPGALAKIAALKTALAGLHDQVIKISAADVVAAPDTSKIAGALNIIKQQVRTIGIADIADVNVEPSRIAAQLLRLKQLLQHVPGAIPGIADLFDLNVNPGVIVSQLARLKSYINKAAGGGLTDVLDVNLNTNAVQAQIQKLKGTLGGLAGQTVAVGVRLSDTGVAGSLAALKAQLGSVHGVTTGLSFNASLPEIQKAAKAFDALIAEVDKIDPAMAQAAKAKDKLSGNVTGTLIPSLRNAGGWFGILGTRVTLFGGLLPGVLGSISALHLALDLAAEALVILVPATIALAAALAAAAPTARDMYNDLKNIFTVSQGLNVQMPGLSGGFQKIVDAVKPNVYVAFGEALNTINNGMGIFGKLAVGAARVLDNLGARAEIALGSQGLQGLLLHGVGFLQGLGNTIGNVFGILGNLLKAMPGYAAIFLRALQGVTGALEAITAAPVVQGFLKIGLAIHGAFVYAGLLATGIALLGIPLAGLVSRLARLTGGFDSAAAGLDKNASLSKKIGAAWTDLGNALPLLGGRIASLGRGIADVGGKFFSASGRADLLKGAAALLLKVPIWGWVALGVAALGGLVYWLSRSKDAAQKWYDATQQNIASQTTFAGVVGVTRDAIAHANTEVAKTPQYFKAVGSVSERLTGDFRDLNTEHAHWAANVQALNPQLVQEHDRIAQLTRMFGSAQAAQAAMNQVGIKASDIATALKDAWARDIAELQGLIAGLNALGFSGGRAQAALNALNFAGSDTQKALKNITTAQDQLLSVITGGEQAFIGYANALVQFSNDGQKGITLIRGLDQGNLKLAGDFYNTVLPAAQKQISALQQMGIKTGDLTTVVATLASGMLSFTDQNSAAKAVLVSMIQNALGPGVVSMKSLDKWVGANATSMSGLQVIVDKVTGSASQMAKVLQDNLNVMLAQAAADALGGKKALTDFATGVLDGNSAAQLLAKDGGAKVLAMFKQMYQDDAPAAKRAFVDWAVNGLGLGTTDAGKLWDSLNTLQSKQNDMSRNTLPTIRDAFRDVWGRVNDLGTSVDELSRSKLPQVKNAFFDVSGQVNGLTTALNNVPKNTKLSLSETGTGSFNLGANIRASISNLFAEGGYVTGGTTGTADDVLARVSRGELIVPAGLVSAGAVDHLRGLIPGFAGGGYVNPIPPGAIPERIDQGVDFAGSGPILAIGNARIIETGGGGWPGGPFMSYQLTSGPDSGRFVYVAENIRPVVRAGQTVSAGQVIANMFNGGTGIEIGWAASGGFQTLARVTSGYHEGQVTPAGSDFEALLVSLGAPRSGSRPVGGLPASAFSAASAADAAAAAAAAAALLTPAAILGRVAPIDITYSAGFSDTYGPAGWAGMAGWTTDNLNRADSSVLRDVATATGQAIRADISAVKAAVAAARAAAAAITAAAATAGTPGIPGGVASGSGFANLVTIGRYLMGHGATRIAAAGIAGDIYGESAGNPESVGSGGFGLIGWTGNTIGLPPGYHGPTGNPSRDLAIQMAGTVGYINANGGFGPINAASNVVQAGQIFSSRYERPLVLYSDTRPSIAQQVYNDLGSGSTTAGAVTAGLSTGARLDSGGWIPPGLSAVYNGTGSWERLSRTGSGMRGGGDTYLNVSVNVPAGAVMDNPVRTGRVLADLIKPYINNGGTMLASGSRH